MSFNYKIRMTNPDDPAYYEYQWESDDLQLDSYKTLWVTTLSVQDWEGTKYPDSDDLIYSVPFGKQWEIRAWATHGSNGNIEVINKDGSMDAKYKINDGDSSHNAPIEVKPTLDYGMSFGVRHSKQ